MIASICLLAYAAALAFLIPRALTRVTGGGHSPKLAVTVWLTAIAVAISAWIAGTAGIVREVLADEPRLDAWRGALRRLDRVDPVEAMLADLDTMAGAAAGDARAGLAPA